MPPLLGALIIAYCCALCWMKFPERGAPPTEESKAMLDAALEEK